MVFRALLLKCTCGKRFCAKDEGGIARKGAATVRAIIARRVKQTCPKCKKQYKHK